MTDLRKSGHKFSTTHKFFLKDDIPENRLIFFSWSQKAKELQK